MTESESFSGSTKSVRILCVEDDESIRNLLGLMLKGVTSTLDTAENGLKGLEKFKGQEYDLVFMDIQMPVMDGIEACKKMREWEEREGKSKTPIVALTAHGYSSSKLSCEEAGCDGHITKPIVKQELTDAVKKYARQ